MHTDVLSGIHKKRVMIKKLFTAAILGLLIFTGCSKSKDGEEDTDKDKPAAKAQFDNNNYGIYKGVFVGSSGFIIVNINNDNSISASLTVDGAKTSFTTTQTVQQNEATSVVFKNGNNSFTFVVGANGSDPIVKDIVISGHPEAAIVVIKETSTDLVKCYEGTFDGGDAGVFNAAVSGKWIRGLAFSTAYNKTWPVTGTVSGNNIDASGSAGSGDFKGSISGDNISGSWKNSIADISGTWSGKRTL